MEARNYLLQVNIFLGKNMPQTFTDILRLRETTVTVILHL